MKGNQIDLHEDITKKPNSLILISMLNFVLGGLLCIPCALWIFVAIYGIFLSGDPLGEKVAGLLGCYCLILPSLLATTLFIASGIGVFKLKSWGYYTQIATAIVSILSIIGIPYGIPVLMIFMRPEIKRFFSENNCARRKAYPYIE